MAQKKAADKLKKELEEVKQELQDLRHEIVTLTEHTEKQSNLLEEEISELMKALTYNVEKTVEVERIYEAEETGAKRWWDMAPKVPDALATEIASVLGLKNPAPRAEDADDSVYPAGWDRDKWEDFLNVLGNLTVKRIDSKSKKEGNTWVRSKEYFVMKLKLTRSALDFYEYIPALDKLLTEKKKIAIYSCKTQKEKRKMQWKKKGQGQGTRKGKR